MIIYYSLSGHTKAVATQISEKTGDRLYEIELDKPYIWAILFGGRTCHWLCKDF
nr:flavodoxin [Leuconostoc carnosum]